jgi:hypothetical protein
MTILNIEGFMTVADQRDDIASAVKTALSYFEDFQVLPVLITEISEEANLQMGHMSTMKLEIGYN